MMSEIKDAELDVARLMDEIRAAARSLPLVEAAIDERPPAPSVAARPNGDARASLPQVLSRIPLRTESHRQGQARYALSELLQYYDEEFVEHAYRAILRREADAAGRSHYLEQLRAGRLDRIDVLRSLRFSAEGRDAQVHIIGLPPRRSLRRLYSLPKVGYFVEWLVELARLPRRMREQREFEAYAQLQERLIFARQAEARARQEEIAAHINQVCDEFEAVHALVGLRLQGLDERLTQLAELGEAQREELREEIQARQREFQAGHRALEERLRANVRELAEQIQAHALQFSQHAEQVAQRLQSIAEGLQGTRAELRMQEKLTLKLLEGEGGPAYASASGERARLLAEEKRRLSDSFYAAFEEHFRGSREEIIERLRVYLPALREAGVENGLLDLGSGRGEWLELLREEGIGARGLDTNLVQVEACRARGLEVSHADALAYLRSVPDNSVRAVTAFHLIEHLEFESLVALLDEAMRVLVTGGLVIFETPNPENVSVTGHNFYVDPTHKRPLPVPMMEYLFEARGYCRIRVLRLHPSETPPVEGEGNLIERFNHYFYGPMDYAIIGSKA